MLGDPPGKETPPGRRPPGRRHPPEGGTPLEGDTPWKETPPGRRPPKKEALPGRRHPPEGDPRKEAPPQHMVNERPVRILQECILVNFNIQSYLLYFHIILVEIKIKICKIYTEFHIYIKPDTPINVYTRFCLNTAKSKFSLVSPVADW